MIRVVTTRRLRQLEADLANARERLQTAMATFSTELALTRQARDFYQVEATKWERRACRFIDDIGVGSATLSGPAMSEPTAGPRDAVQGIMRSLNVSEINRPKPETPPSSSAAILGVSDAAAREAVAGVLS